VTAGSTEGYRPDNRQSEPVAAARWRARRGRSGPTAAGPRPGSERFAVQVPGYGWRTL